MDEIKNCKNCGNYIQHYSKDSSPYIHFVDCGHCGAKILGKIQKTQFPNILNCKHWQPKPPPQNKYDSAVKTLLQLIERVNEIVFLIEEYKKQLPPE